MDDARMDDARIAQADGGAALPPAGGITPTATRDAVGPGRFAFRKAIERDAECGSFRLSGMIVAELEGVGPSLRGRLADAIDDAVERELAARGAAAPGLTSSSDRDAALSDQLFRARRVGASGIAIVLGPLRAAAGPLGALEPEDCATLRFLAGATRERPVILLLDERDASTGGYAEPVPLGRLLIVDPPCDAVPSLGPTHAHALEPAHMHAPTQEFEPAHALEADAEPEPAWEPAPILADAPARAFEPTPVPSPALSLARHTAGANVVDREEAWRAWTLQLVAARGPQPLATLERLFTDSYMPLANALGAGLDDTRARSAHDEFRSSFAKSYSEAFPTFAATTKRPRMVLDVHDSAGRIARLHGARSTRMLLVDAMRWDVSRLVQERLAARLGERAVMTDELVLWSALPSTTMRQLETIARGVDALRSPGEMDTDAEPPRGRTAEYVRRLRVGPREVHKLDVVESRLQGARGGVLRAIPEIAEATAEAIARHAETLAPNTLLFVFGDHGFSIDRTGTARQGGASPEEVLVGAFALLVGDVH
ncbi:MAG TPA: hypothetical protein VK762_07740 [Polyangiaceae bacterium]|nr:hypothetical protein [Polyangiaceae bacterium]